MFSQTLPVAKYYSIPIPVVQVGIAQELHLRTVICFTPGHDFVVARVSCM